MQEFKLSPLMLFILLLLILVVASYYSSWAKSEGFTATTDENPFTYLINYNKYYKNLVNVSGNFWYDPKNGNLYRITLDDSGNLLGATIFDRSDVKYTFKFTATTANEPDKPTSIITNEQIDSVIKCWVENDVSNEIQLNYIAVGKKTYIIIFDTTTITTNSKYAIKKMLYFEDIVLKKTVEMSSNNEVSLVSADEYKNAFEFGNGYDETYVTEPLYDSTILVYQITKTVKFDENNGNLIVNAAPSASATPTPTPTATPTPTPTATATPTPTPTATATPTPTPTPTATATATPTPTPTPTPATNGFRNFEGFYDATPPTKSINVFKRKMSSTEIITTPTYDYSKKSILDETASVPYFVSDQVGHNTILYWPTKENTLIVIFANALVDKLNFIPFAIYAFMDVPESPTPPPKQKQYGNEDEILDEYLKWSKYMLKTEVVTPVCPACPSCKNGSGGLCTDCGGNGGCGTKCDNGKSLAIKDEIVRGPSGAVASLGNSAANIVEGTAGTAANLVGGTIGTAANLVGGTIGTAADLLKSTGKGVTNLLKNDMSRVGYNQSYVNPTQQTTANGYNRNNTGIGKMGGAPIDTYSYNGALQSKGSNFRPITASFQAFSK